MFLRFRFHIFALSVTLCTIWYHLCNLKNVKNTHGTVILLFKLKVEVCNFTKSITFSWMFFTFLNCTNGTKLRKASHLNHRAKIYKQRTVHKILLKGIFQKKIKLEHFILETVRYNVGTSEQCRKLLFRFTLTEATLGLLQHPKRSILHVAAVLDPPLT